MEPLSILTSHWGIFLAISSLAMLGMVVGSNGNEQAQPGVAGGARRKRRTPRDQKDRGLPSRKLLYEMAQLYLTKQREYWPNLAQLGVLPNPTKSSARELAEQFELRFRDAMPREANGLPNGDHWKAIAGAYVRFSCDKSNPRSLVQQLGLILDRAKANGHFVPWDLVFADAAVSATTSARRGYTKAKEAIASSDSPLSVLYIDEVGRASRDAVEAMRLGRLVSSRGKKLLGVSDAFDSSSEMSKLHLSIFAMVQEWFVDQLKSKVHRGMRDAFYRGTNLRPPAFGYRLIPAVDEQGKPIRGRDGEQCRMLEIDPAEAKYVRLAFRLYGERGRSRNAIARYFNRRNVGNQTWDASRLKQFFQRHKYVGINVENMSVREIDIDEEGNERRVTKRRPRSEWRVRRSTELQIVSWTLWKKVQQRLDYSRQAYSRNGNASRSRSEVNPTTLVRPICGSCNKPMWLGKSGKYASFTCLNGREGKNRCKHRGYKSVKIVETAILNYIKETVATDGRIEELVAAANAYLREEAAKPQVDTSAWRAELKSLMKRREHLADIVESEGDQDLNVLVKRLRNCEARVRELRTTIRDVEAQKELPEAISIETAIRYLASLRDLLRRDIPNAALLLREITGPIVIRLEKEEGRRSATWYADFTVNLAPVALKLSREAGCPTARTWEYLNTRSWKMPIEARVRLKHVTQYERLGPEFARLHRAGAKVQEIASAYSMPWKQAKEILEYGMTGTRPKWPAHGHSGKPNQSLPLYKLVQDDVVTLRDTQNQSWLAIRKWLETSRGIRVSEATIRRAYDDAHSDEIRAAVRHGGTPSRGLSRRISAATLQEVQQNLQKGELSIAEIGRVAGVSESSVRREKGRLESEGDA